MLGVQEFPEVQTNHNEHLITPEEDKYFREHDKTYEFHREGILGPEHVRKYKEKLITNPLSSAQEVIETALQKGELSPSVSAYVENVKNIGQKPLSEMNKVSLIVPGKGFSIEGFYAAAALQTLMWSAYQKDASKGFSHIYGTSGGAGIATYVWNDRQLLFGPLNPVVIGTKPLLDIVELLKTVYPDNKLIPGGDKTALYLAYFKFLMKNYEQLKVPGNGPDDTKLTIIATNADPSLPSTVEARRVLLTDFTGIDDLLECIQSSCTLPLIAGPTDNHPCRGMKLADGVFSEHIPIATARNDGNTFNIILESAPLKDLGLDKMEAKIAQRLMQTNPGLAQMWLTRMERTNATRRLLAANQNRRDGAPYMTTISPDKYTPALSPFRDELNIAGLGGAIKLFEAFGIKDSKIQKQLLMRMWDTEEPNSLLVNRRKGLFEDWSFVPLKRSLRDEYKLPDIQEKVNNWQIDEPYMQDFVKLALAGYVG